MLPRGLHSRPVVVKVVHIRAVDDSGNSQFVQPHAQLRIEFVLAVKTSISGVGDVQRVVQFGSRNHLMTNSNQSRQSLGLFKFTRGQTGTIRGNSDRAIT